MKSVTIDLFLAEVRRFLPVSRLAVGVSAGMDSMLLAETLVRLGQPFTVLHFDHRWREKESREDAKWLRAWCEKRSIPFVCGRATTRGVTSEAKARAQRWAFFQRQVKAKKIEQLWLAHHADDLVETFLINLMRGSGADGLEGMSVRRELHGMQVVRPLLSFFREQLLPLAHVWGVQWREDATNRKKDFLRNRVRLDLIPFMEQVAGREVRGNLWKAASLVTQQNADWEAWMPDIKNESLETKMLKAFPLTLQRKAIHRWLIHHGAADVSFGDVHAVVRMLDQLKPSKINLSRGWHCRRTAGKLWIEKTR